LFEAVDAADEGILGLRRGEDAGGENEPLNKSLKKEGEKMPGLEDLRKECGSWEEDDGCMEDYPDE